jgi:hypothetical protein
MHTASSALQKKRCRIATTTHHHNQLSQIDFENTAATGLHVHLALIDQSRHEDSEHRLPAWLRFAESHDRVCGIGGFALLQCGTEPHEMTGVRLIRANLDYLDIAHGFVRARLPTQ